MKNLIFGLLGLILASSTGFAAFSCECSTDGGATFSAAAVTAPPNSGVSMYLINAAQAVVFRIKNSNASGSMAAVLPTPGTVSPTVTLNSGWTQFTLKLADSAQVDFGLGTEMAYVMVADQRVPAGAPPIKGVLSFSTAAVTTITAGGTYFVSGANAGALSINTIEPVYIIGRHQARLVSPASGDGAYDPNNGTIWSSPASSNTTVIGVCIEIANNGMFGCYLEGTNSVIQSVMVASPDTSNGYRGRGGLEVYEGGRINQCIVSPGDDAIRLTDQNTVATNCMIHMLGNGSAMQLGYNKKFNGYGHTWQNIRVFGTIRPNLNDRPTTSAPGRGVLGGVFPASGGSVAVTGLDLRMTGANSYVRLATGNPNVVISGVSVEGTVTGQPVLAFYRTDSAWLYPFNLMALNSGSSISDVSISLLSQSGQNPVALPDGTKAKTASESTYVTGPVAGSVNGWSIISPNQPPQP